jgi:uncharacterized membrane protein YccC
MRRTATLAATALLTVLPLTAGCSTAQKAWDCGKLALQIASDVQNLQNAVSNAVNDPQAVDTALQGLTQDLDRLGKQAGNADVAQAVKDLKAQADAVRQAADAGRVPDLSSLSATAINLGSVCTGS